MKTTFKLFLSLLLISALLLCLAGCATTVQVRFVDKEGNDLRFGGKQVSQSSATAVQTEVVPATEVTTTQETAEPSEQQATQSVAETTAPSETPTAAPSTTAAPAPTITFPLVNENNGFTLKLNADGTFTHEGVYNMDLSNVGIKNPLPIEIRTTGNYAVNDGSISLSNTKMVMNCSDETANSLSGLAKIAAKAIKNTELTDKSTAAINGGQLVISFVGNNGSADFALSTHTFSADQTSALLSR